MNRVIKNVQLRIDDRVDGCTVGKGNCIHKELRATMDMAGIGNTMRIIVGKSE